MKRFGNIAFDFLTKKSFSRKEQAYCFLFIFIIASLLRLLVYHNTLVFSFSDYRQQYEAALDIADGKEHPLLVTYGAPYTISFIAAWFIINLGSISYWFFLNILLSVLSIFIMWAIVKKVTGISGIANLSALFISVYSAHITQTSVFYTQIIMIFLESLIILLILMSYQPIKPYKRIALIVLAVCLWLFSAFFKFELRYLYLFLGVCAIIQFLKGFRMQAVMSLLVVIFSVVAFQLLVRVYQPFSDYVTFFKNDLFLFGQTPIAGGEGMMLDEYKESYAKGLEEFRKEHASEYQREESLVNSYNNMLIKDFILHHPLSWIKLQIMKFFRTLGIKPEGVSFKILVSGKIKIPSIIAGTLLTFPFIILFIISILLFNWQYFKKLFYSAEGIFMLTLFVYFIAATIFYPHYQIRYRLPLEIFFLCPAAATFIYVSIKDKAPVLMYIKKHLPWKIVVLIIFIIAWAYETYDIFVVSKTRYLKNAEQYEKGIIP